MKEATLENDILQYLQYRGVFAWRTHTGRYPPATPGMPDIVGVLNGKMIGVEVKRPGQKPTKVQADFIKKMNANGAMVIVASDVAGVQAALA